MGSVALLMWGLVFSAIGFAFFTYGRKQQAIVPLVVGITLFIIPYFISNVYALVGVGGTLVALPYFVRL